MPPVTLKGHICTGHGCYPPRPSAQGEPHFRINGIEVHLQTHAWSAHGCATCPPHASVLAAGAAEFRINAKQIGRIGDPVACGSSVAQGVNAFRVEN